MMAVTRLFIGMVPPAPGSHVCEIQITFFLWNFIDIKSGFLFVKHSSNNIGPCCPYYIRVTPGRMFQKFAHPCLA